MGGRNPLWIETLGADVGSITEIGATGSPSLIKIGPASSSLSEFEPCPTDDTDQSLTRTCLRNDGAVFPYVDGCIADVLAAPAGFSYLLCRL